MGPRDRGVNAVLRQVEAAAVATASGNQAGSLHRDSGVIPSQSLLLLGAGVSHKHHLPDETAARSEHLSAGRGAGATCPLKENKGIRLLSWFYLRHTAVRHGNVKQ